MARLEVRRASAIVMARDMVTDSLLDAIILRSLDARDEMVPPWELRPDLVHGSLGWRMGAGEALLLAWKRWLDRQPTQRTWRVAYFRRHVAPRTWTPVVVRGLVEGAEDERHAIVERERCVADDVAYAAWVRRGEPPLFRPLHGGDSALGVRECAFWLRLARLRRRDAAWLASHEVPEEWRPIVAALHGGPVPELPGLARVYGYLAREGTAPPPSVLGEPLDVRAIDSYAWAWHAWMERAFDDRATLAPHLARADEAECAVARMTPAFAPHAAPYDPDPLAGLDEVDWRSHARPTWSTDDEVASALRDLANPDDPDRWRSYHRLLSAVGNDHAGTYFPIVLPVIFFLGRVVRRGSPIARLRALDALVDLVGSFEPDPDHTEVVLGARREPLKLLLVSSARMLTDDVEQVAHAPASDVEAKLAKDLLSLLRE